MKTWGIFLLVIMMGVESFGADLASSAARVSEPKTATTPRDILSHYLATRDSLPPMPSPVGYLEVVEQLHAGRFDFVRDATWVYSHDGGTLYLSAESARTSEWDLPMTLLAYESLPTGQIVLAGIPESTGKLQCLALVDAPGFAPTKRVASIGGYLMNQLWPRRIVWTATLEAELGAGLDPVQTESAAVLSTAPMMMALSAPAAITEFEVVQDGADLSVTLPNEFAGADLTLERSTNLAAGAWAGALWTNAPYGGTMFLATADLPEVVLEMVVATNLVDIFSPLDGSLLHAAGSISTNHTGAAVSAFYRIWADSAVDSDSDGLGNVAEYALGTDFQDPDGDGDGASDGYEALVLETDPMDGSDVSQAQADAHDAVAGDPDGDSSPDWREELDDTNSNDFFD